MGPVAARLSEGIRQQWISWDRKDSVPQCAELGEWGSRVSPAASAMLALTVLRDSLLHRQSHRHTVPGTEEEGRAAFYLCHSLAGYIWNGSLLC